MPKLAEPFIFPSHAIQVFYSVDIRKDGWKVVLRSDARARREVVDTSDVFIATTVETKGLIAPELVPPLPQTTSLVGQSSYQQRIIYSHLPSSRTWIQKPI
jgi:hypothetical protein